MVDTLIQVYSENTIVEVERERCRKLVRRFPHADTFEDLLKDAGFRKAFEMVRGHKKELDNIASENEDKPNEQKIDVLFYLKDVKSLSKNSAEVLGKLVKGTLYPSWSKAVQTDYDKKYEMIVTWNDYFISYTTRNIGETNYDYKQLYEAVGFPLPPPDETRNYVAQIIVRNLYLADLHGFVDWKKIRSGDFIKTKLDEQCKKSFSFVQLLEKVTFVRPEDEGVNWCFKEFTKFDEKHQVMQNCTDENQQCYFFIAGLNLLDITPRRNPEQLHVPYQPWYKHVHDIKYISLVYEVDGVRRCINKDRLYEAIQQIGSSMSDFKKRKLAEALSE